MFHALSKGQNKFVVSENFPKKQGNIARISAVASKMGQIKKNEGIFYTKL